MAYKIEELKLGDILDQGIKIVRDNIKLLLGIFCFLWIPFFLISGAIQFSIMPELPPNPTLQDYQRINEAQIKNLPITLPILAVYGLLVLPLTNAAVIYAIAERYLGRPITASEAFKQGLSKILPLIGTTILMNLAIFGGMLLCLVPGILFALWFGLAQHVVILEGVSGGAALKRSKELVRPNLGTFLILGFVLLVLSGLLKSSGVMIPNIWLRLAIQTPVNAVTDMVLYSIVVVFYFSCRCGLENFDLEHLANSIGEDVPTDLEDEDETDWASDESE